MHQWLYQKEPAQVGVQQIHGQVSCAEWTGVKLAVLLQEAGVDPKARTYGARRVWHDLLAEGISCGLHRIERLMRLQALKARPRRRRLPPDLGERQLAAVAPNVLDRTFEAPAPNRKWIADFTYVWTAEGWLYVAAVVDLFSRRVVGWSM